MFYEIKAVLSDVGRAFGVIRVRRRIDAGQG